MGGCLRRAVQQRRAVGNAPSHLVRIVKSVPAYSDNPIAGMSGGRTPDSAIRRVSRVLLALVLPLALLFYVSSLWALDPHKRISQYGHTAWRTQDGVVRHPGLLVQTDDGYLVMGTVNGLARFDGVRATPWIAPNSGGVQITQPKVLVRARDGSLWIGTGHSLFHSNGREFFDYTKQLHGAGIGSLIQDHAGAIWFTRYRAADGKGPLCRVNGEAIECYGAKDGIPLSYALGLAEDSEGNIWFGSTTICHRTPASVTVCEKPPNYAVSQGVSQIATGADGEVWLANYELGPQVGMRFLSLGKWDSFVIPGFDGTKVRAIKLFLDRNGSLWIGTESQGLYRCHDGVADHYGVADGLSGNSVTDIYEDKEGNLWVTTDKGLDFFRDTPVVSFSIEEGLSGTLPQAVLALPDNAVWVANTGAVDTIRSGRVSSISEAHALRGREPQTLFEDRTGRIWLGFADGIMIFEQGHFTEVKGTDGRPLGDRGFGQAFAQDIEGNIWAVTNARPPHLLLIKNDRVEREISLAELFPRCRYLAADPDGGIWMASSLDKVARYRDGKVETISLSDSFLAIFGISVDSDHALLVPTAAGLYRWKAGQLNRLDSTNGLPCSTIFAAIKDNYGAMWLYAACGLMRITPSDWATWLKSPRSQLSVKTFDSFDGTSAAAGTVDQPRAARSPDGRLWFASYPMVQMIDPAHLFQNDVPPPVHIQEVIADRKSYPLHNQLRLPPRTRDLEIDYTALSFAVPQRVQFRYKLEGRDQEWQDPGMRRQAFYTDLRPGNYKFRVIASNNDGVWNKTGETLSFIVSPAWYQTNWFRFACLLTGVLFLIALHRLRMRQVAASLSARFHERVDERTRIARELHDTLLQSLHGLMFQFQAARNMLPRSPENAMETLDEAISGTEQAIAESRDAIQDLRSQTPAGGGLAQLLKAVAEESVAVLGPDNHSPAFHVIVEGEPQTLSPMVGQEVYSVARELIRNAFRHADARRIEVEIRYDKIQLRLRLRDDGKGIDSTVLEESRRPGHWGLPGVRERAKRIGARLDFWSETGAGTEVELTVPAAIAYQATRDGSRLKLFRKAGNE